MDKDILIIGGGINGVGTAADLAGRGLSVVLCEMNDLASATSSASSKLIHGGLRYLEHAEFKLVHESLQERKILLSLAPYLVKTQAFVMPHCPWLRPYWMVRLGLYFYDLLSFDPNIPKSQALTNKEVGDLGLKPIYNRALQYYDCKTDDSRLVLNVAQLAKQHGAEILTRTKLVKAVRKDDHWVVTLLQAQDLKVYNVKAIVNASGPWVQEVATEILSIKPKVGLRLVKGSHIIVPKLNNHKQAFILQTKDKRVVFVIPYMKDFSLIGTTDIVDDRIDNPTPSTAEIEYLCNTVNEFLQHEIAPKDVVHKFAGIRALQEDLARTASEVSRDWYLEVDDEQAPVISIYGGKLTTYRNLSESIGNKLTKYFPRCGKAWTKKAYLPGGYFPNNDVAAFRQHLCKTYPRIPEAILKHYINNYGTRAVDVLMNTHNLSDLGQNFGGVLYQREVDFLIQTEWARTAEDILWRRGKQGLWFKPNQVENLENYMASKLTKPQITIR